MRLWRGLKPPATSGYTLQVATAPKHPVDRRITLLERLFRAVILDRTLYEEVAADRTGLSQAFGVVILAGIVNGMTLTAIPGSIGALFGIFVSVVGWLALSGLTLAVGNWALRTEPTSWRVVGTCLGFADTPSLLNILGVAQSIGMFVRIIVWFWLLAATAVAASAAFRVSLARGAAIGGLGFGAYMLIGLAVGIWST